MMNRVLACLLLALAASWSHAAPLKLLETPLLQEEVKAGKLPPVEKRVPETPLVVNVDGGAGPGQHGGTLNMLIGRGRDVRMLVVYGYARLVAYDSKLRIIPDILESIDAVDERVYTMKLRQGHKWSDGHAFTVEDFRYFWEDVANNKELSPTGPPSDLIVDGKLTECLSPFAPSRFVPQGTV